MNSEINEINNTHMQALGNRIKQLVVAQLRAQVPSASRNPFATGKLAGRINPNMVEWRPDATGNWQLSINLDASGLPPEAKYTNFGTRNHNEFTTIRDNGIFGLPWMRYSKGGPGVRAQNWTSMSVIEPELIRMIQNELKVSVEQFLQATIQSASNDRI